MSPNLFNKDLSRAQSKQIHGVSDLVRGDEHGAIKFTYSHDSVPKPVVIHMIARDCMTYPQNSGFVIFSESDDTDYDIPRFLDSVCQKQKWSDIEGAVRVIATALTSAIEKRDQGTSDSSSGSDDSLWDYGSDSEDLEPIETTRADGDHQNSHGHDDHAVVHSPSASTLATLSNSLKKAQSVGIAPTCFAFQATDTRAGPDLE
ncbi:ubiquitin-conjugating enzyme E2 Q2 [Cordyceps fumosorosea ARSEF 2679]|uniref:Ubiquitin-conjugating enzyme E2 Q2 n=1 Tax=Cordyceps fumosorosea (strain ARSEF 2679) TaxID=1081104 RepID=A0A162I9A5_CORFA|nr:ubiquitin-conjugating enzyme E2 Q2 [Cordyceps fumosorosea ARSEF 2679]OAA53995.1 ubiquitin-conjugating enzyme E2 Q2 [Cordyceps fumosorosea ARSEF 2679]